MLASGNRAGVRRPSVEDIAAEVGISLSTAYRILRGSAALRTDKHLAARRLLQRSGYLAGEPGALTVLAPLAASDNAYMSMLDKLVAREALARDVRLAHCLPESINEFVRANHVDGIISHTCLQDAPVPYVAINHNPILPAFASVCCDEALAMAMVFEHLVSLGHRRIAFFDDFALSPDRYCVRRSLIPHYYFASGAEYRPELVYSERVAPNGHAPVIKRAVERFLALPERPTAIVLPADCYAICFYEELKAAGLRVPEDMSVTGFDDEELARFLNPPLTTVRKPFEEMVSAAMSLLFEKIKDPGSRVTRSLLRAELVVRGSVADLRRGQRSSCGKIRSSP